MKLYSYIVAQDTGFAPNPFYGFCTLATCKPRIRSVAQIGDWILGTGAKKNGRQGTLVYAMRVTEKMSYDSYWQDPRFECKRPNLNQSKRESRAGDNIYHLNPENGDWVQEDSCFCGEYIWHDTQSDNVLISDDFIYLGGGPPLPIPEFNGVSVCHTRNGHRSNFDDATVEGFISWVRSLGEWGYCDAPLGWENSPPFKTAPSEWAVEQAREALRAAAGAWKDSVDAEELKRSIYADRLTNSRPEPDL